MKRIALFLLSLSLLAILGCGSGSPAPSTVPRHDPVPRGGITENITRTGSPELHPGDSVYILLNRFSDVVSLWEVTFEKYEANGNLSLVNTPPIAYGDSGSPVLVKDAIGFMIVGAICQVDDDKSIDATPIADMLAIPYPHTTTECYTNLAKRISTSTTTRGVSGRSKPRMPSSRRSAATS